MTGALLRTSLFVGQPSGPWEYVTPGRLSVYLLHQRGGDHRGPACWRLYLERATKLTSARAVKSRPGIVPHLQQPLVYRVRLIPLATNINPSNPSVPSPNAIGRT